MKEEEKIPLDWLRQNWRQNTTRTKCLHRSFEWRYRLEILVPQRVGGWEDRLVLTWEKHDADRGSSDTLGELTESETTRAGSS